MNSYYINIRNFGRLPATLLLALGLQSPGVLAQTSDFPPVTDEMPDLPTSNYSTWR